MNKNVLDAMPAAHELAVRTLRRADRVFWRQRRAMEDGYHLPHGTFAKV